MLNDIDDDWIVLDKEEKQESNHDYWFILLPAECILGIFSYITEPITLLAACCTCRQWNYLGENDKFWELFLKSAKTNKMMEYVGAQESKLLEYCPPKERYLKIFMKGSTDKHSSSNKLQLILETTDVRDDFTLQGELVATIYDDTLTIGGIFVYLSMSQYLSSTSYPENDNSPLYTEFYWQIPEEDPNTIRSQSNETNPPLVPLRPKFYSHPFRRKISEQAQIQPHLLHKGTYHWPFLLKIPTLPPSMNLQVTPNHQYKFVRRFHYVTIKHRITGLIYGVPGGILSKMFSDRLVESQSIVLRYLEHREDIVSNWEKYHPPKSYGMTLDNGNKSTWKLMLDKPFYVIGEVVTLSVDFSVNSGFLTPQSLQMELMVIFNYKGKYFLVNIDKQKYPEVIPENQLEHKFQLQFRLRESIFDKSVGPLFICPAYNMQELSNRWLLHLYCGDNYISHPILIVNDKE